MKFSDLKVGAVFTWADNGGANIPLRMKTSVEEVYVERTGAISVVDNVDAEVIIQDAPFFAVEAIHRLSECIKELSRAMFFNKDKSI